MTKCYVPDDRCLEWYERDGEAVVFNPQSGRSHFVNALTSEVLHCLQDAPRDSAEIEAHIQSILEDGEIPNLDQQIRGIVKGLLQQGLVDPWPR